ncbi:hypothetical protein MBLNU459_g8286t2 [Dothideomycetes sp. NU459]
MQSISHFSGDLTLLYSETKKKALSNVGKCDAPPALSDLHRKLRIQKDRLITWGIEWAGDKGPDSGDIDESIARAGFTETVTSVLGNIKEVLEQAEKIKTVSTASTASWPAPEKPTWYVVNEAQYQDLLNDLTTSIDILYDLSRARRALATGSHPTFSKGDDPGSDDKATLKKSPFQSPSFASSELTLVNPSFTRPNLSPYAGLPASIDPQALRLPAEEPPPYESFGIPTSTRMVACLIRSRAPESVRSALKSTSAEAPVLIEFENYDPLYRDTGVPPPLERLEKLAISLQQTQNKHQQSLTLLGYFEDPHQPRIGLVYDFLSHMHGEIAALGIEAQGMTPVSLLNQVQAATKTAKAADAITATPFLEDRFRVALRVTEALMDLHAENFFHGNLNSGSVIFLQQGQSRQLYRGELHRPLLSSFDLFSRSRVEYTTGRANFNITKHPNDQAGSLFDDNVALRYDLYGLGLLLLEIGLWTPLHDLYKQKYSLKDFKLRIEKIWIPRLAAKCGSLYMRAVQTCLRLSDDREVSKFDIERIYSNIIGRLQRCCLLDEDESIQFEYARSSTIGDPSPAWSGVAKPAKTRRNVSPAGDGSRRSFHHERPLVPGSATSSPLYPKTTPVVRKPVPSIAEQMPRSTSQSTINTMCRAESFKESIATAADSIQNALQLKREAFPYSFREYRQKVMLIQSYWRQRCMNKSATSVAHQGDNTVEMQAPDHHHRVVTRKESLFPVKLPQYILDDWQSNLGCRLSRIVERALKGSPESSTIDLVGLGHDLLSARATIIVTCTSTAKVKAALKRKFDYDRSRFDLKNPYFQQRPLCGASIGAYLPSHGHLEPVSYGGIVMVEDKGTAKPYGLSVHHMLEPQSDEESSEEEEEEDDDENDSRVDDQSSTTEGSDEDSSSSSSSDGRKRYPHTASQRRDPRRSSRRPARRSHRKARGKASIPKGLEELGQQLPRMTERHEGSDEGYNSNLSELGDTDDEDEDYMSSDFESEPEDTSFDGKRQVTVEPGDRPGIQVGAKNKIQVTQPAFDDAMAEELHVGVAPGEGLDADHLDTYSFGKVFASSGLKRWHREGVSHEIDWALIELEPPRIQPYNLVQGGRQYCKIKPSFCPNLNSPICRQADTYPAEQDIYPTDVVPASQLAGLAVHCFSRTSGLQGGTIAPSMSFVKIFGRSNYSTSWSVIGDFGVGGDSGAWVIDNASSRVCGHVLAERGGITYICPMDLLFQHIQLTLGAAKVSLPGSEDLGAGVDHQISVVSSASATAVDHSIAGAVEALGLDESKSARLSQCRAVPAKTGRRVRDGGRMREGGQTVRA